MNGNAIMQTPPTASTLLLAALVGFHAISTYAADPAEVCAAGHLWKITDDRPAPAYQFTWNVKLAAANKMLLGNHDAGNFVTLDALSAVHDTVDPQHPGQWAVLAKAPEANKWQAQRFDLLRVSWIRKIDNASTDCAGLAKVGYIAAIANPDPPDHTTRFLAISAAIKAAQKKLLRHHSPDGASLSAYR